MPEQLTALSCSKLARPSGLCGRVRRQSPPQHPPLAHHGQTPKGSVRLCLPIRGNQTFYLETRHGPASLQTWNQAGSTEARVPTQQAESMGSQVPPWGRGAGKPPCQRQRGETHHKKPKDKGETALVVQRLRTRLPMPGTGVRSMVWEDSTCHRATKAPRPKH